MKVTSTNFTIAEYCAQMDAKNIIVNTDYQRSSQVWPQAAKSFLIDTILSGYPIPKLSLYQKTDIKTRQTIKEIIDGQQRSKAVKDFYDEKFKITFKGEHEGLTYKTLSEEQQREFLEYPLSVDVFIDANDSDIRELFRRTNSYNVPLNEQEKRHSTFQGKFKWFIHEMSSKYSQALKEIGVFREPQLARMEDARFLADICVGFSEGIVSASESKISNLYKKYDADFPDEDTYRARFETAFNVIFDIREIHKTSLVKKYHLYCLFLAIAHHHKEIPNLSPIVPSPETSIQDMDIFKYNLSALNAALEQEGDIQYSIFLPFIKASSKSTDTLEQRKTRFEFLSKALLNTEIA